MRDRLRTRMRCLKLGEQAWRVVKKLTTVFEDGACLYSWFILTQRTPANPVEGCDLYGFYILAVDQTFEYNLIP
jgi:hypothetical protein